MAGLKIMTRPKNPVQMAVIGAAHGIRGELRVKTFTGDPLALADYGPLYARDGRAFEIADIRPAGSVVVVRFKGVSDRNAAEALRGWWVRVPREQLPPLGEREHYRDDLLGFEVVNLEGERLGELDYFVDLPTGSAGSSVMVVKEGAKGSREHWVPAGPPHLKQVDVAARRLVVDWPSELA